MPYRKKTCAEYIKCIKEGGAKRRICIDEIYKEHFGFVYRLAKEYHLSKEDVISIYNEAVSKLIVLIDSDNFIHSSPRSCSNYIFTVAKNLCYTLNNRSQRYIHNIDGSNEEDGEKKFDPSDVEDPPEILGHFDKGEWKHVWKNEKLSRCFEKVTPKCQEILRLWAEGFSMKEIIEIRGDIPNENNAGVVKYNCLKQLKKYIREYIE